MFRGEKQELPGMTETGTEKGYIFAIYYDVPLQQRIEAFGSDLTSIISAYNKITYI